MKGVITILSWILSMAAITMPSEACAQTAPGGKDWVVVIDAGHGGKDPGTIGSKSKEKNINLAVALKTGKYISENIKNVKVIYTRDDDTFVELAERAEVANRNKADIFISIHANGITDRRPYGAETWVLGQSMDKANLALAMKENSVITYEKDYQTKYEGYDPNSVESFIIFALMQNTYLKQSTEFASMIQDQFRDRVGRRDRGVKQAGLIVLWRSTMPSVLVELGFLSNADEEKFLLSDNGQDFLASAIFRAFRDYKNTIDNRSGRINATDNKAAPPSTDSVNDRVVTPGENSKPVVKPVADSMVVAVAPASHPADLTRSCSDDLVFMVQIAALPRNSRIDGNSFSGIEPVTAIDAGDRIKYGAGKFNRYEDAIEYRKKLTDAYPDAFVIAVKAGKIIPLREGIEEKNKHK